MAKEFFKDLPDTTTPLTATRLNGLLDGEEVIGNIVVDSIRTKNMFDKSTTVQQNREGTNTTGRLSTRQLLWLEAGTYTFSTNMPSTFNYGLATYPNPLPNTDNLIYDSGWQSASTLTFTLSTASYFSVNFRKADNSDLTVSDISSYNFQLEEGSTATTYSPYQNLNPQKFVLYENPSGTSSSFNLSEYWRHFREIEVYFLSAGWLCNSSKMDCNSNTSLVLTTPYGAGTTSIALLSVIIQFSGTTVSFIRPRTTTFDSGSANVPTINASADIKVTKVIGYR